MRTTLEIDDHLLARAKALAAVEHASLTRIIEEALALRLRPTTASTALPVAAHVPIIHGAGGLSKAVKNPADNREILDLMDSTSDA
ncbi:MAG: DUF2191 domain-containing protein [Chloroflexota bacterium]